MGLKPHPRSKGRTLEGRLRKKIRLVATFLIIGCLVMPVLGLKSSQSISSYGIITYPTVVVGVGYSLEWRDPSLDLDLMKGAGIKSIIFTFRWNFIEKAVGVYDYSYYDSDIDKLVNNGIELVALIGSLNDLYDMGKYAVGADLTPWGNFIDNLVTKYKDKIKYWVGIWEIDAKALWSGTDNYDLMVPEAVRRLKFMYEHVKTNAPNAVIVAPFLQYPNIDFLQRMYDEGAGPYMDIVCTEAYSKATDPLPPNTDPNRRAFWQAGWVYDTMVANGDGAKEYWVIEFGWSDDPNDPDDYVGTDLQAEYVTKALEYAKNNWSWCKRLYIYTWSDPPGVSVGMGIVRGYTIEPRPKPAYYSVKNFIERRI